LLAHEAAFALGQMQDAEGIPALEAALNDLSLHPIVRHEVRSHQVIVFFFLSNIVDGTNCFHIVYAVIFQAAEALGAIGLESNVPFLKNSLTNDPAQEVRETCELALKRIEEMNSTSNVDGSSVAEKSPFMSVDPAAPASFCSSVDELRYFVYGLDIFPPLHTRFC